MAKAGAQNSLSASTISKLVKISYSNFNELTHTIIHPDDLTLLSDVESMYRNIWNDSTKNAKKGKWASIKKTTVNNGPPNGPDLRILSSTAKLAQSGVVELLTFDNDFILFADEIMNQFGISVKNGWLL